MLNKKSSSFKNIIISKLYLYFKYRDNKGLANNPCILLDKKHNQSVKNEAKIELDEPEFVCESIVVV